MRQVLSKYTAHSSIMGSFPMSNISVAQNPWAWNCAFGRSPRIAKFSVREWDKRYSFLCCGAIWGENNSFPKLRNNPKKLASDVEDAWNRVRKVILHPLFPLLRKKHVLIHMDRRMNVCIENGNEMRIRMEIIICPELSILCPNCKNDHISSKMAINMLQNQ